MEHLGSQWIILMEELTVVYFVPDQTAAGRKKRKGDWIYHTEQRETEFGSFRLLVITVYLPVFYRKKKKWEKEEWQNYYNSLPIPEESSRIRYHWQEDVGEFLTRAMEPLSMEWISLLLFFNQVTFTELLILDDRDMPTEELINCFVSHTRSIKVITAEMEQYEELTEDLYEEYGFLLTLTEDAKDLRLKDNPLKVPHMGQEETLLVIAGKELYHLTPAMLPENAIWLSTEADSIYEKKIDMRAKLKKVISMQGFWQDVSRKYNL